MPDGEQALIVTGEPEGSSNVRIVGPGGGSPRVIAEHLDLRPAAYMTPLVSPVSPDGRYLAAATASGRIEIVSLEDGARRALQGSGPNDLPIQWTPTGRSLYLFDPSGLPGRIYEVDVATGRREVRREIGPDDPSGVAGIAQAAITPDARAYAYSFSRLQSDLYLMQGLR